MRLRSLGYFGWSLGLALVAPLLAAPPVLAGPDEGGARPMELGRFVIAQVAAVPPLTIRAQFSFQVLIQVPAAEWEAARLAVPAYRDIIIRTAYGYAAYVSRNGATSSPERLAHLIAARFSEEPSVPVPVFVTLPNFQEVRPPTPDATPRELR